MSWNVPFDRLIVLYMVKVERQISMLSRMYRKATPKTPNITPSKPPNPVSPEREAALRELYERIAQGHTMAEAEDKARRKWTGR